jgi:glycoside/pentoside/hexuronide:cation symporter, GPH family
LGGLIVSGLLVYTKVLGGDNEPRGWQLTMGIFGIAALVFFLITFFSTKERIHPPRNQQTTIKKDLFDLFRNRPWVLLLFIGILMILFVSTRLMVTPHYFKYYIADVSFSFMGKSFGGDHTFFVFGKEFKTTFELLTWAYNITSQITSLIGTAFAFWFAKRFGKRRSFIGLFAIAVISTGAIVFLGPENLGILFLLQILGSISGGPLTPLIWAMYADTADYSEYTSGRRATGLVFSASTMAQKIGWALGSFIAGILLSAVGFVPDVAPSEEVRTGIKYLISIIPAFAGFLAIVLMFFYDLDDRRMSGIQQELAERRK